jgi:sulfonate transport system permease protein
MNVIANPVQQQVLRMSPDSKLPGRSASLGATTSRAIALHPAQRSSEYRSLSALFTLPALLPTKVTGKWLRRYGAILLFLLIWQLAAQLEFVDPAVIPPVSTVVAAMARGLGDGVLLSNMLVSLGRSGTAFGIAIGTAVPLGLFMGSFKRFEELTDSLLQLFRQTSALAFYPIFILLLGLGEVSKVSIICWAAFFPVLLNTISGVKLVDGRLIEMARVFGASRAEVFRRVVLPAATPAILSD